MTESEFPRTKILWQTKLDSVPNEFDYYTQVTETVHSEWIDDDGCKHQSLTWERKGIKGFPDFKWVGIVHLPFKRQGSLAVGKYVPLD